MNRNELIEALKTIHKEIDMSVDEYADYINEKHQITDEAQKVTPDRVWSYRTGSVGAQIEIILREVEKGETATDTLELISHLKDRPCEACEFKVDENCQKWACVFDEAIYGKGAGLNG